MRAKAYERSAQLLRGARDVGAQFDEAALMQAEAELVAAGGLAVPPLGSIELLSSQDYYEIEQLYTHHNQAIDNGRAEEWAATFTPDGVFKKRFVGRQALMRFVQEWRASGASRQHWNGHLSITGTSGAARASVYVTVVDTSVKPVVVLSTDVYSDDLVKTSEGWRFKSRVVEPARAAPPRRAPGTSR